MGGIAISDQPDSPYDFERLERAVQALVDRSGRIEAENVALRDDVADRDARIQELSEQVRQLNQRRQDAGKRVDDLIRQLEALDAQFARLGNAE